ncbi:MAG TPA: sensor histidine kinase [Sporichthya sp.]|nr:sensor histidine kinase [Sporichthya sp.]
MFRELGLRRLDIAMAAGCGGLGVVEALVADHPPPGGAAPQAAMAVAVGVGVALRCVRPLESGGLVLAAVAAVVIGTWPYEMLSLGLAVVVLLPFSYAINQTGRVRLASLLMLALAMGLRDLDDPDFDWFNTLLDQAYIAMAAGAGYFGSRFKRRVDHVARAAAEKAEDDLAAERARIARELHDIVGHGMSVMIIQADAARECLGPENEQTRAALAAIEATGRDSLREMRRLLGLLRDEDGAKAALAPPPGLADLPELLASVRGAGLPVELTVEGVPGSVSKGTDLAAYRVIQEALTNTLRHAGPARARVRLEYGRRDLELVISDDGHPNGAPGAGRGLVGMRERVRLYGGTFSAGRQGEGWVVTATLPLDGPGSP